MENGIRLIYAHKAENAVSAVFDSTLGPAARGVLVQAIQNIEKIPTADAVPVVHGRWTPNIVNNYGIKHHRGFNASCCGRWSDVQTRYCPNCGARMDGKRGDCFGAE